MLGGLVGSILGQMMCPIPFLGALLGGMIGSMFGSMLDNMFGAGAPCCCHNMGQHYGPYNAQMGFEYGYPMDYPYAPPGFHNPHYGCAPPLFPNYQPPVAPHGLPQLGFNPFINRQEQHHTDQTTQRPQVAVAIAGKNEQVQTNVHGHNQGPQVAATVVGANEQRQENVHGNNQGTQVAVTAAGTNTQAQTNVTGDNQGTQVAVAAVGANTQTQENVHGDNSGSQTAVTAVGVNTQAQTTVTGDNSGTQTAIVGAGTNTQVQASGTGDNSGDQTAVVGAGTNTQVQVSEQGSNSGDQSAVAVVGSNTQVQASGTGDNSGDQTAGTVVGGNTQSQTTVTGNNSGVQDADTVLGEVTQERQTEQGHQTGAQQADTVVGDVAQTSHAGGSNVENQTADTVVGDVQQVASGGDGSNIQQDADTLVGDTVQAVDAGQNSVVVQETNAGGHAIQEATVESGMIIQDGGNEQRAASTSGGVVVEQQGDRYGDAQQTARGSDESDVIEQRAGQGTLNLFDNKTTADVDLGGGNDQYTYEGNSEANHVRVNGGGQHQGPDDDVVRINTHGGNDTAVVNLSGGTDNYQIDMGSGNDRLVINEHGQRVRVVDAEGREIYRSQGWTEADGTARVEGMENLSVYREDGSFARWDSRNGLQEGRDPGTPGEMSPVGAARLIREHAGLLDRAAGNGSVDGIIGRGDLQAALDNPETPPELREAIQYTLNNESVWRAMDASGARGDRVDMDGLNRFIDGYETRPGYSNEGPMTDQRAASILNYHNSLLDTANSGGGQDGKFNEDDLRAIASGQNAGLPPELREAAQRLLGDDQFAERVDAVSWETGGLFDGQRTFSNDDLAGFR